MPGVPCCLILAKRYNLSLMIQATDFEFRNRWWLFGLIFGAGFFLLAVDHVPIGSRIADRLAAAVQVPESTALHIVFGVSAVIMLVAALVRVLGVGISWT